MRLTKLLIPLTSLIISFTAASSTIVAKTDNPNATGNAHPTDSTRQELIDQKKTDRETAIEDKKSQAEENRLEKGKEKALAAIDRRLNDLEQLKNRMQDRKRIRQQEQTMINNEIDEIMASLNKEREQVENAGDLETLKNQFKNSIENSRVYAVIVPKVRAIALTSAGYNAIDRLNKVFSKVEAAIAKLPAENQAEAKNALQNSRKYQTEAKNYVDKAMAEFKQMQPAADTSTAKSHLEAGKGLLKQAREQIKLAVEELKTIRTMVQQQNQGEDSEIQQQTQTNQSVQ